MSDEQDKNHGVLHRVGSGIHRLFGLLEPIRHLVINLGVLIGILFGGPAVYKLVTRSTFVIKDISVPSQLSGRGYSGEVIAQQILDHIAEIDRQAGSKTEKAEISGFDFDRSMPSINLPVGGFNLAAIVTELRTLFGYTETKVTGEVYVAEPGDAAKNIPAQYGLRLRIAGQAPIFKTDQPSPTIEPLIEGAAQQIMRRYDPINLGYFYYRKRYFQRALAVTDEVLAGGAADNVPWAYTMRGLIARDQGHQADAAINLREAIARAPKFWLSYVTLAGVLRLDGKLEEAEATALKAVELAPDHQDGHTVLALIMMDRGRPEEALKEMQKGVAVDSKDASGHLELGRLLVRLRRFEDALTSFKTSAALKPAAEPLLHAAGVSMDLKREADAIALLLQATHSEPKNPSAWVALGEARLQRNEINRAAQAFKRALALDTVTPVTLLRVAKVQLAHKRLADSERLFAQASAKFSKAPEFLLGWSEQLWATGKKAEAVAKIKEALASDLATAPLFENAGRVLAARGETAEALETYKRAIALDSRFEKILRPLIDKLAAGTPAPTLQPQPVARRADPVPEKQAATQVPSPKPATPPVAQAAPRVPVPALARPATPPVAAQPAPKSPAPVGSAQ